MTHIFKVALPNIKGFARIYELNDKDSLYHFHKQMVSDMDFPPDQMVLFKAFDESGNVVARYATFDLGYGSIEHISIAHAIEAGVVKFIYFYDTTNKKSVIITLEGEGGNKIVKPTLIESKGPNPEAFLNGYVAFEDLPPEKQRASFNDGFDEDDDYSEEDGDSDEEEDEDFQEKFDDKEDDELT